MAKERRAAVLVAPDRVDANPPRYASSSPVTPGARLTAGRPRWARVFVGVLARGAQITLTRHAPHPDSIGQGQPVHSFSRAEELTVSTQPLRIALAGREHVADVGTTAAAVLAEAGLGEQAPGAHAVIAARVNGELRDLNLRGRRRGRDRAGPDRRPRPGARSCGTGDPRSGPGRAGAVPGGEAGHRAPDRDGFDDDFDAERLFAPEDLKAIEQGMRRIVNQGQRFSRRGSPRMRRAPSWPLSLTSSS